MNLFNSSYSSNFINPFSIQTLNQLDNLSQVFKSLAQQADAQQKIYPDEIPSIFAFENQVRQILHSANFSDKSRYQTLYDQHLLPLLKQVKQFITQQPFQFSVQAAAAKGKAVQAGLQALKYLAENDPVLIVNIKSKQQVFLLPEQEAVFKRSHARAQEEERLVNDLFDLTSKQAVVGTFHIQRAIPERFGMSLSPSIQDRGFKFKTLSSLLLEAIKTRLSVTDKLILENKKLTRSAMIKRELMNYQHQLKRDWYMKLPQTDWQVLSFNKIQNLHLANSLPLDTHIGLIEKDAVSFEEHIRKNTLFFQALNYFPTLQTHPPCLYLFPDLRVANEKKAYERCEEFRWTYVDAQGKDQEVDFKTLHARYLEAQPMTSIQVLLTSEVNFIPSENEQTIAFNVPWKIASSYLIHLEEEDISPLENFQAKPFIDMFLLDDFHQQPLVRENLLNRLTPESEFNAVLTGEMQLLDLHGSNLGMIPKTNSAYEKFKDMTFSFFFEEKKFNFKALMQTYLSAKLTPSTLFSFQESGQRIFTSLQELPELQEALDMPWNFVIFDTDLSLTEDNQLQQFFDEKKQLQHLIPLRSVLLRTHWKDQALSDVTVQRLLDSKERDLRVKQWVKKEDAPIYKRISPSARDELRKHLLLILPLYSLSKLRQQGWSVTIKELQSQFAFKLSDLDQPTHLLIWQLLEKELSSVKIFPNDTWEKIAERYPHQNIEELKQLNPTLNLTTDRQMKINYDLTSSDLSAQNERRKLALQLFPRLTYRQQMALFERQMRRRNYLTSHQALFTSTLEGEALIEQIRQFINQSETPLTTSARKNLLNLLKNNLFMSTPQAPHQFRNVVCDQCRPSYFNLMSSMYPLLADTYALSEAVYGRNQAGITVGCFTTSLEKVISKAKLEFPLTSCEFELAQQLDQQIRDVQNPAFFK